MKKIIALVCAFLALTSVFFAGCRSTDNVQIDVNELAGRLLNEVEYEDEMVEIEFDVLDKFYVIDTSVIKSCKVYKSSSGATAEEIAVFEAKTANDVDVIKNAVRQRVEDLEFNFKDYIPKELDKIEKAQAAVIGKYVVLFIVNDYDAAKSIVNEYIK